MLYDCTDAGILVLRPYERYGEMRRGDLRKLVLAAFLVLALAPVGYSTQGFPVGPCGSAPPGKPHRRKGGESVPPLPLPATPLRRSEKKRPPSPPPLIAKIRFGDLKKVDAHGKAVSYYDWNKDPGDLPMLLNLAGRVLGIRYTYRQAPLLALDGDPARYPVYYYTGSSGFSLSDKEVKRLREFVVNGGTIWGDTCYGDPEFFAAFVKEMNKIFPERWFKQLGSDHPLFHCFYNIDKVNYIGPVPDAKSGSGKPIFFGMDYGCRTAVILGRYDMSCGWDGHMRKGAHSITPNDARKLGINMLAYTLAYFKLARFQSATKVYYEKGKPSGGDFVFGQIAYPGNWDPHPNGTANLLRELAGKTSAEVKFKRQAVKLDDPKLLDYPFLYLTGQDEFKLTEKEAANLRRYLLNGGFLFADACCGRRQFDASFRREMARVLPAAKLQKLAVNHPVTSVLYKLNKVEYSEYTKAREPERNTLDLEGITVNGNTIVLYSRYSIGTGWIGFDIPFSDGLEAKDALKIGVNTVVYAMTH